MNEMAFNNMLSNLKEQESNYVDSGTATSNRKEFTVGYCNNNLNGQRVMELHLRKHIEHRFFGPAYPTHTFEGELPNSTIIGWKIRCIRPYDDNLGGNWKRINKVIGTKNFQFKCTSCFMRDLYWEIFIYYI